MADQNENQDDNNNNEGNNPQASGNNQGPQSAEAFNANPALYSYGNAPRQPASGQYVPLPGVPTSSHQASPSPFPQQVTGGSQTTGPQQGTAQQAFAAPIAQRFAGGQTPYPAAGTPGQTSNQSSFPPNNTVVDPSATGRILRNEYGVAYIDSPYLPDGFKHYYTISQWGAPGIGSFALPPTVSQPQPWDPSMLKPEKKSPFLQFLSNTLGSTRATSGQPNANLVRFVFAEDDEEEENNDNSNNDNEAAESEPEDEQGNGGSQEDVLEGWQFRSVQQARLHRARQRQAAGHQVTNRVISQSLMDRQAEHVLSIHDAIRDVSSETGANQSGPRGRGSRAYRMLTSGPLQPSSILCT